MCFGTKIETKQKLIAAVHQKMVTLLLYSPPLLDLDVE
jgi:hypothetical protein